MPFCGNLAVEPTAPPADAQKLMHELWTPPDDVAAQDMTYGPWGKAYAPDASKPFIYDHAKTHGVSPGFEAKDEEGRQWSVKFGDEGHVEVVLSRVLSAVGYHQPPVYYVDHFKITDTKGTHDQGGARFRPKLKELKERGDWAWQQNPFVGTDPYQGLLVIMMLFNSTDLKNDNNTLYEFKPDEDKLQKRSKLQKGSTPQEGSKGQKGKGQDEGKGQKGKGHDDEEKWYVVRDLGSALGETGRLDPQRNDPVLFAKLAFINGVHDRSVEFNYHGFHQELYSHTITPENVRWGCELVGRLTDQQWHDVFASSGYEPDAADSFIAAIKKRIDEGRHIGVEATGR